MSEESTTSDLVELSRRVVDAMNRGDFDALMGLCAPDAVWEVIALETRLEGAEAICDFMREWTGTFEDHESEVQESVEIADGITLTTVHQTGRPAGGAGEVEADLVTVGVWIDGRIVRAANYRDVAEARAAAERLAEERRRDAPAAMSEESTTPDPVELTRRLIDAGNRRDLDAAMSLFVPDVVWESLDGLGVFDGATAVRGFLEDWLSSYEVFHIELEEALDLGGGIAFAAGHQVGRLFGAAASNEQGSAWAIAWQHGLAVRVAASVDIDKARAAAEGLAQ